MSTFAQHVTVFQSSRFGMPRSCAATPNNLDTKTWQCCNVQFIFQTASVRYSAVVASVICVFLVEDPMVKLLVVEDESKTADYLRQGLMEAGFVVDLARTGLDGLHLAKIESYAMILLDVMLPDMDGWRIMQSLREAGSRTAVLFLTARDSVEDRAKGLELGADDYLVKPFAFAELLARAHALATGQRASAVRSPASGRLDTGSGQTPCDARNHPHQPH